MLTRFRPLLLLAVAMLAGALALPAHALQFNYSTRLTLTDCNDADEAGFQSGLTMLCYDLTAGRDEIWNGSAWVAYQGGGSSGGVQYTEGDTDATIDGTALMWEDADDTLRPVSASKPLPVTNPALSDAWDDANDAFDIDIATLLYGEDPTFNAIRTIPKYTCTRYTGDQTAIKTGAGILMGIYVDGVTANDDLILYDNTANSGTVLWSVTNLAAGEHYVASEIGAVFVTGLSLDATFTTTAVMICFL